MKYFYLILLFVFPFQLFAQEKNKSKEPSPDFYIYEEGQKVFMYGEISMSAQYLTYDNEKNKSQRIAQKKVKAMVAKGRLFVNLPITKHMVRLHEIIGFNDKYILSYYFGENVYYVFDRENNMIEDKLGFYKSVKKNLELFEEKITPYFTGCKDLIDNMKKNLENKKVLSDQITYVQCGEKGYFDK